MSQRIKTMGNALSPIVAIHYEPVTYPATPARIVEQAMTLGLPEDVEVVVNEGYDGPEVAFRWYEQAGPGKHEKRDP